MILRAFLLVVLSVGVSVTLLQSQPPGPPPPAKFKCTLRYFIPAPRDEHVRHYDAMIRHLVRIGFEFDPPLERHPETDREDRAKNYIHGFIASDNATRILDATSVQSISLIPAAPNEFSLPENPDEPVHVRLELPGGLSTDRQRELQNQARVLLRENGFKEAPGYDHFGYTRKPYTRIVGTIPRGKFDLLNRDMRSHPAGWLGPIIPRDEIPLPLRDMNPIRVIEVLRDKTPIKELADPLPRETMYLEKISADLWNLVNAKGLPPTPIRVQIGFAGTLQPEDREWKQMLRDAAPGHIVEGYFGSYVTAMVLIEQVRRIAASPSVSLIRMPRVPSVDIDPKLVGKGDNGKALNLTGLNELHARGYTGEGVRIGIIDANFRGWEELVKKKQLPATTTIVDLTTEFDAEVEPAKYASDPAGIGHGAALAQAAALAAPQANIVLIRAEIGYPHQLHDILRYVQGGRFSAMIEYRHSELLSRGTQLQNRREHLLKERKIILDDFTDETDLRAHLEFLGPFFGWLYSDREWHYKRMDYHRKLEAEQRARDERFRQFMKTVRSLEGIPILVNALSWNSGYPLGAGSPLARALDDPTGPLWFQAVGNTRGQVWHGPFRHTIGDPVMKFVPDGAPLPKERWSNEVQFLAWHPYQGKSAADLPNKLRVRLTVQWREPHDPDYFARGGEDDLYVKPLAGVRLHVLRQRDPGGKTWPADVFESVARTGNWAERIEHLPNGSLYEQVLETSLDQAGVFAIRIEKPVSEQWVLAPHDVRRTQTFKLLRGLTPTGIRPIGVPTLPALEKDWDLRPRVFADVLDEPNRVQGRVVFADFPTDAGTIGMPADARNVISVGAANFNNKPQSYSAFGSPAGMEMASRPWLYAYDELELAPGGAFGTSVSAAFAAGTTAAMLTGKMPREQMLQILRSQQGKVLRVPLTRK